MKKTKIALATSGVMLVAFIVIVVLVALLIVYTADLTSSIDYSNKTYAEATNPVEVTVASYNIRGGYTTRDNLIGIRDALIREGVDIVGHQEVDSNESMRTRNVRCIETLTNDVYANKYFAATNSLFLGQHYGIMTMSRHAILENGTLYLPMPNRNFMLMGEPRVCTRNVVKIAGVDVAFYNAHLSFENGVRMPEDGSEMRAAQLRAILDTMESDPCPYKVLVGDMNILSFDELDLFEETGHYKSVNNETSTFDTYRGDDVTFHALDNIIYSSNMELVTAKMLDSELSDHNMLVATLKIA